MLPDPKPVPVRIDRCVCKDISFRKQLHMAETLSPDIGLIALATGQDCFSPRLDGTEDAHTLIQYFGMASCGTAP
jgi:hypothetical protein